MRNLPKAPSHIVLVGPMGAGKSSIGRQLAAVLQRAFVDLDACIEAKAGKSITAIFASEGEAGFRSREGCALKDVLMRFKACVIATGGGAVMDEASRRAMHDAGTVIYLQVEPALQMQRLAGDGTRPLLATDNPAQRLSDLQAVREPLYREVADHTFDTTQYSPEGAAAALVALLAQPTERYA